VKNMGLEMKPKFKTDKPLGTEIFSAIDNPYQPIKK
jgi:hypothetical protein